MNGPCCERPRAARHRGQITGFFPFDKERYVGSYVADLVVQEKLIVD